MLIKLESHLHKQLAVSALLQPVARLQVPLQVATVAESLGADVTHGGLGRVRLHVVVQAGLGEKSFGADGALMRQCAGLWVLLLDVGLQLLCPGKTHPTHGAAHGHHQVVLQEAHAATAAVVGPRRWKWKLAGCKLRRSAERGGPHWSTNVVVQRLRGV